MENFLKPLLFLVVLTMTLLLAGCQTTSVQEPAFTPASTPSADATNVSEQEQNAYADFTQARYEALLGQQPFALFFHAAWCPTCWVVEKDILENLSDLPEGAVILKVDYDKESELKAQYKIISQSMIVVIDANGEVAKTLVAPDFSEIKSNFVTLLNQ